MGDTSSTSPGWFQWGCILPPLMRVSLLMVDESKKYSSIRSRLTSSGTWIAASGRDAVTALLAGRSQLYSESIGRSWSSVTAWSLESRAENWWAPYRLVVHSTLGGVMALEVETDWAEAVLADLEPRDILVDNANVLDKFTEASIPRWCDLVSVVESARQGDNCVSGMTGTSKEWRNHVYTLVLSGVYPRKKLPQSLLLVWVSIKASFTVSMVYWPALNLWSSASTRGVHCSILVRNSVDSCSDFSASLRFKGVHLSQLTNLNHERFFNAC